jgi:uncharacterized protein involved in outer membrane biogenesis
MSENNKLQSALKSPRTRKYGLRLIMAVLLLGVLGFFVLPPIVKHVAVSKMSELLHRPVAIESISINPYALSLTLEGLEIKEREGGATFAGFDSLYVNVQAASLFRWGPVINEIKLVNPTFRAVRVEADRFNFSDLIDEFGAKPEGEPKTEESGPMPAFSLNNIQISGGKVEFDDRVVDEKHVINEITLMLPFVSSMAYATDIFVEPHFSATINGAPLALTGKSKPFADTRESEFVLALDNLQLPKYFDYSPVRLPVKMDSGTLDTDLTLVFRQEPGNVPKLLLSGAATVKNLRVVESSGAPLVAFGQLDVAVGAADLFGGKFAIEKIALDAPDIVARVSPEGGLNWLDLLPKSAPSAGKAKDNVSPVAPAWSIGEVKIGGGVAHWIDDSNPGKFRADVKMINVVVRKLDSQGSEADFEASWSIDGGDLLKVEAFSIKDGKLELVKRQVRIGEARLKGGRGLIKRSAKGLIEWIEPPALRVAAAAQNDPAAPWRVDVARYVGEDINVRFEDAAVSPKATHAVEGLSLDLANLSTEPAQATQVKAAFRLNRKGNVAIDGSVVPMPLNANLNLDLKSVELLPLQPYFSEKLNIDITRGLVTAKGNVQLRLADGGKAKVDAGLTGGFAGQLTIGDFQAVDKLNSADFLRWKSLHLGKIDVRLGPESVSVGDIALADFFARVIVSPDGKLNLLQIVRDEGKPDEGKAPEPVAESSDGKATAPVMAERGPVLPVKIGKITLQGGSVRFTDNFIKPNYSANLREIGGSVTGLSSEAGSQAKLELRGNYDNVVPLTIAAQINPLSEKPYLDLQADVKGIELTALSAYSGKYAGYAIDKGKLSLFVKYKIENDQLEAENRVFLDQLTFGDAVESAEATSLPVKLAVSLLKNRAGEIDINLPISGSLNDPEFSVGGLIVKVIVNLLGKALTSPFALIGSMFGGGEELSNVEFDAGRATLAPEGVKRLEILAKALLDRPGLKLEIEGKFDPELDPEGLKRARIDRKVRAAKREELTRKNVESGAAETVEVSAQEYPALLERVYREEKFPKPRNAIGMIKSLPVEEMEKLMLANSTVNDDDLRALADRRSKAVRDWLVGHEVPMERLFLLPSKAAATEEKTNGEKKLAASRVDFSLK